MLAYFGCDQSQVQRYLTAKSVDEGRESLMMSAYVKIPLQALVLLTGVLVFVFYLFNRPPMLFNPKHESRVRTGPAAAEYAALEQAFDGAFTARRLAAERFAAAERDGAPNERAVARTGFQAADARVREIQERGAALVRRVTGGQEFNEVNYVFPTFVTTWMPTGLVGLMIAAIFAAAMSSIAAELNSLSTATVIDFYRRHLRPDASDAHYLLVSKLSTGVWGLAACTVAV